MIGKILAAVIPEVVKLAFDTMRHGSREAEKLAMMRAFDAEIRRRRSRRGT